jgi:acetyltransferase-like isoleucine patch superfamily enzyme
METLIVALSLLILVLTIISILVFTKRKDLQTNNQCNNYYVILDEEDADVKESYNHKLLSSATIVGTAKNIEKYLPNTIKKLEMIANLFYQHQIIIYENDSNDKTLSILKEWKSSREDKYDIKIISETNIKGKRTHVLSYARNLLLKEALKYDYEYFIVVDLDDVITDLDEKGILSSFELNNEVDWAGIGGNQNVYYDIWALRTKDDWLKFDWMECYSKLKDYNHCCISRHREINPDDEMIEVESCFGGIMIYKTKYIKDSRYYGGEKNKEVCEHVNFNNGIRLKNNGRLFINPKMITSRSVKIDKIKHIFDDIYSQRKWTREGNGSGSGSSIRNTTNLRMILTNFILKNGIKTVADASCGSCLWTSEWLNDLKRRNIKITYYGFDIADEAVTNCAKSMSYLSNFHNLKIKQKDISEMTIPDDVDLLLSRDTLQHLSFNVIFKVLNNFAKYENVKFYIIGGYLEKGDNVDIKDGDYFSFNISKKPFGLIPNYIIKEKNLGNEYPKYLFVFEGDNFRKQVTNSAFSTSLV